MNTLAAAAAIDVAPATAGLADAAAQHLGWLILGAVCLAWIVFGTFASVAKARAFERSRRKIAAYVAEGSIAPDDAKRLISCGPHGACTAPVSA